MPGHRRRKRPTRRAKLVSRALDHGDGVRTVLPFRILALLRISRSSTAVVPLSGDPSLFFPDPDLGCLVQVEDSSMADNVIRKPILSAGAITL